MIILYTVTIILVEVKNNKNKNVRFKYNILYTGGRDIICFHGDTNILIICTMVFSLALVVGGTRVVDPRAHYF